MVSINVASEQARIANVTARAASGATSLPDAPTPPCQPGVFSFLAVSVAAKAAATGAAAAALEARMLAADNRSDEAVVAYDEMNVSNAQSLELI
jgi:hypothetical protein